MAMTPRGLTPCPGGDCHGIDHAWCAPPRHAREYDELVAMLDRLEVRRAERLGVVYAGRHRKAGP